MSGPNGPRIPPPEPKAKEFVRYIGTRGLYVNAIVSNEEILQAIQVLINVREKVASPGLRGSLEAQIDRLGCIFVKRAEILAVKDLDGKEIEILPG